MRCRSCGSTILNTMQQVFGAIGTSIATCLLSMGSGATDAKASLRDPATAMCSAWC